MRVRILRVAFDFKSDDNPIPAEEASAIEAWWCGRVFDVIEDGAGPFDDTELADVIADNIADAAGWAVHWVRYDIPVPEGSAT